MWRKKRWPGRKAGVFLKMQADHQALSHVIFGWDPLWVSTILFVATYAVVVSERVNRAIVAGLGAGLMVTDRGAESTAGGRGGGFQHPGSAHGDDGFGGHNPALRRVPVCGDLVGQEGGGQALGHPAHVLGGYRRVFSLSGQCDHGTADRPDHPAGHRRAEGQSLSVPVRGDLFLQHRRFRDPDR